MNLHSFALSEKEELGKIHCERRSERRQKNEGRRQHIVKQTFEHCRTLLGKTKGETRALIGEEGVNIHIFVFCPTNFF